MDAPDPAALGTGVEEISLSVEETNKLRAALGLKPLDESSGGGSRSDQIANANFAAEKRRLQKRQERKELIERLAREQNKERMFAKLEGKGLGEAEEGTDDPLAWARRHKKAAAENKRALAERKMRELEELDRVAVYSEKDLAGLKVGHSLEDIKDEILVLADKRIGGKDGDDEEDELVSSALTAKEQLEKNLKNKSKKSAYSGYDDDEFNNPGKKRSVLSQYDEEQEKVGFVLGENGRVSALGEDMNAPAILGGAKTVTLEYEKMQEIKDYYTQEEAAVTFLKPKKKKKKAKLRSKDEPDWPIVGFEDSSSNMDVETTEPVHESFSRSNANSNVLDVNFVDDDDLQKALSRARNLANKIKPPNIEEMLQAAETAEGGNDNMDTGMNTGSEDEDDLLVLTATSEFVNTITTAATAPLTAAERAAERRRIRSGVDAESDDEENDSAKDPESPAVSATNGNSASAMNVENGSLNDEAHNDDDDDDDLAAGGIEEEPLVSAGLGATLKLLGKQGFIEKVNDEQLERERKQRERAKWLAHQRFLDKKAEILKERDKAIQREINKAKGPAKRGGGGGGNRDNVDREDDWKAEEEMRAAERQRLRELEERFKDYSPDVNIKYNDEFGRELKPKEAFRLLSHKFHGKGSGKMKTEKRLLRMDEEVNLQKMKSSDTPLGTAAALLEKTKANKAAHLVLSVGNRGSLPSEVIAKEEKALMDKMQKKVTAAALAKTGVKKVGGAAGGNQSKGGGTSTPALGPAASSSSAAGGSGGMAPGAERGKVAFGLAPLKRKAEVLMSFEDTMPKRAKE
ncbi:hypothetical protein HDU82_005079 [Entophlyctis luteolus]|nr:hypothetical protein HDU82_005079 [Entophlyctis luteolus]